MHMKDSIKKEISHIKNKSYELKGRIEQKQKDMKKSNQA